MTLPLTFVTIVHVLLCVFMVFVILLQPGKDAGMGAALGGGAATSAFGGRGAVTFLGKVTAVCATAYFMTSLGLSFVGLRTSVAAVEAPPAAEKKAVPADATAPGATPAPADAEKGSEAPAGIPVEGLEKAGATVTEQVPGPAPTTEAVPAEKLPAATKTRPAPGAPETAPAPGQPAPTP